MSNEYWAKRMADSLNTISNKNIQDIEKQLKKYYRSVSKKLIREYEALYDKLLTTVGEGNQPTPADLYKLSKYWELQNQLIEELQLLGDKQVDLFYNKFQKEFFDIYDSISLPSAVAFGTISKEGAKQIINQVWCADSKSWQQRIWGNTELLAEVLNEQLVHCVVAGKKPTDLKRLLQERFEVSYSNANTLVRTEIAHVQTQAAKQRYEDYGIREFEVLADKDERRCEVCGNLHKKRYPIGAAAPVPAHPNCRCCIVPVVDFK